MQYIDSNKRVVLVTARNKGHDQLAKDRPFRYGRLLHLDYEDPNSTTLILLVDCLKGDQNMYVMEDNYTTAIHIGACKSKGSFTITTEISTKEGCKSIKARLCGQVHMMI